MTDGHTALSVWVGGCGKLYLQQKPRAQGAWPNNCSPMQVAITAHQVTGFQGLFSNGTRLSVHSSLPHIYSEVRQDPWLGVGPHSHPHIFIPELLPSQINTGTTVEQRRKEKPSRDCPIWGSIPYTDTKPRQNGRCQEVLANRSLI